MIAQLPAMIEQLIACNHRLSDVLEYTPRMLFAFVELSGRRKAREAAEQMALQAIAARGEPKDFKKAQEELLKEA